MSVSNNNSNSDWTSWIPIVILFCIPATWPVALFLLFFKLNGSNSKKRRASQFNDFGREQQQNQYTQQQSQYTQQQAQQQNQYAQQQAQQQPRQQSAPPKQPPKAAAQKSGFTPGQRKVKVPRGRGLTIAGAITTGIFGFSFFAAFLDALSYGDFELTGLGVLLAFTCLGLVLLHGGLSRSRKGKRFRKYLMLIGPRTSVSIDALVKATGYRRRKVLDDLQDMLDRGFLPMGYLDLSRDRLIISDEGIPDEEPEFVPEPEPEKPQDDYAVMLEIRRVNDAIPDPVMSRKIDRIGEITGKILDYQRQNPGKGNQLRSFLNYYLPTTLKILRAYAQLDAQGVEGENISAAKERIEGMMDKVVEGFEKQLDELFRDRAMDITSDVSVLEQMLEKDGLSGQGQGMTLGG